MRFFRQGKTGRDSSSYSRYVCKSYYLCINVYIIILLHLCNLNKRIGSIIILNKLRYLESLDDNLKQYRVCMYVDYIVMV